MKRSMVVGIVVAAVIYGGAVARAQSTGGAIKVTPVQIVSCAPLPSDVGFSVKPMGYKPGFQVYYLLQGDSIIGIKEKSLVVEHIRTPKGVDLSKNRMGNPTYKMGPFPKASDDGKYAVFSVDVNQNYFARVGTLYIKGQVTVLCGSKRETKQASIPKSAAQPTKIGPFSAKLSEGGGGGMMGFGGGSDSVGIRLDGPVASIIKLALVDGSRELRSNGSMTVDGKKTYYFPKPSSGKVVLKIAYWSDMSEKKVSFGR